MHCIYELGKPQKKLFFLVVMGLKIIKISFCSSKKKSENFVTTKLEKRGGGGG